MQNELNPGSESPLSKSATEQNGQEITPQPIFTYPPIAGFWRRFFAWLADGVILGVIGQIIGLVFSAFLFRLGPYGRPIGLLFIIPYFGILNSRIGGGQTLGKRLLKIAVRTKNNESIGLGRSIIRISILILPVLFNQWAIPVFQNYVIAWFLSVLIFGLGGAILYTMIFNSKARQGIHDLLLGTYVIYLPGKPIESYPATPLIHRTLASIWLGLVAIGSLVWIVILPSLISKSPLEPVLTLYNILQDDPRFFSVSVADQNFYSSNGTTIHSLGIIIWYKGKLGDNERQEVIKSVIKTVLENAENIDQYDGIQIKITYAYDIGIANASHSITYSNTINDWHKEIYPNGTSTGFVPSLKACVLALP
jgi:uncharacterized RDD family membrane protein YckC